MFSRRTSHPLHPNALARALEEHRAAGRAVTDLTLSNPTTCGISYPGDSILRALSDPRALHYEPYPLGLPAARAALAAHLAQTRGVPVLPDDVLLCASTSEAYAWLLKVLADPGDQALVPAPSYPLLEHLAALEGVELVPYRCHYDGAWHVDTDDVRARVTARTRLVIAVSPNNPTGAFLSAADQRALQQTGLPLIVDEVFGAYGFGASRTALDSPAELTVALGGMSKECGLPQVKLGWMALGGAPARVTALKERLELVADTFLSVGTPVQHAVPLLLESCATVTVAIRQRTAANRAAVVSAAAGQPFTAWSPQGGWSIPLRLPSFHDDTSWALRLLHHQGLLVHPGYFYDFAQPAVVVLSLLVPPDTLRTALLALTDEVRDDERNA